MMEAGNIPGVLHLFGSTTDNLIESYRNRKRKEFQN